METLENIVGNGERAWTCMRLREIGRVWSNASVKATRARAYAPSPFGKTKHWRSDTKVPEAHVFRPCVAERKLPLSGPGVQAQQDLDKRQSGRDASLRLGIGRMNGRSDSCMHEAPGLSPGLSMMRRFLVSRHLNSVLS
jgi:hypothetical protein